MYNIRILSLIITLGILVSACSGQATPTVDPVSVQSTAVAAAVRVLAETQAAIPTTTPIPASETPTQTPLPTDTPTALATDTLAPQLEVTATMTITSLAGNLDPCNAPLQSISGGKPAKIKIQNDSGAPVSFSIYLNKTPFGDCGFRSYTLGKGDSILITDLIQACYNVSAFINDPKKPTKSFGYACVNNPDKWTFFINRDNISY
jgi:hypothetical protein